MKFCKCILAMHHGNVSMMHRVSCFVTLFVNEFLANSVIIVILCPFYTFGLSYVIFLSKKSLILIHSFQGRKEIVETLFAEPTA